MKYIKKMSKAEYLKQKTGLYDAGDFTVLVSDGDKPAPMYSAPFTVKFTDKDGNVISRQRVKYKHAARDPREILGADNVAVEGWQTDFSQITEDMVIEPVLHEEVKGPYTVTFYDYDGVKLAEYVVEHGESSPEPDLSINMEWAYYDENGNGELTGYDAKKIFTGWDTTFDEVTQDTEVGMVTSPRYYQVEVESAFNGIQLTQEGYYEYNSLYYVKPQLTGEIGYTYTAGSSGMSYPVLAENEEYLYSGLSVNGRSLDKSTETINITEDTRIVHECLRRMYNLYIHVDETSNIHGYYYSGDVVNLDFDHIKDGYEFDGYYYQDTNIPVETPFIITKDTGLYVKWNQLTVVVTFYDINTMTEIGTGSFVYEDSNSFENFIYNVLNYNELHNEAFENYIYESERNTASVDEYTETVDVYLTPKGFSDEVAELVAMINDTEDGISTDYTDVEQILNDIED